VHKRTFLLPALDGAIVVISFLITMLVKPGTNAGYISRYLLSFAAFIAIWVLISYWSGKYRSYEYSTSAQVLKKIIFTNFIIFCCTTALIYLSMEFNYSRFVVLGTLVLATMVELFIGLLYYYVRNSKNENGQLRDYFRKGFKVKEASVIQHRHKKTQAKYNYQARIDFLKNEIGEEAYNFIFPYGAIDSPNTLLIGATTRFTIDAQIEPSYECIINVNRVNDFRYINKFFEAVNSKLPPGGIFIDFFESKNMRKKRLLDKYPPVINYLVYSIDFLLTGCSRSSC
jgi:hypothetical protein